MAKAVNFIVHGGANYQWKWTRKSWIILRTVLAVDPGFELDRNAPEQRSGYLFIDQNGVPIHFLEIPNEIQIAFVA